MRPSMQRCLAGILILFVWSVLLPTVVLGQTSVQAKIDTLNREIKELRDKVDYWKPRLGQGGWIFVPLTDGYWPVRGKVKNPYDVMRETGRNHWVKNTKGNFAVDMDLNTYRNQFRQRYVGKGNDWLDRQWRELIADNDRIKQQLHNRIKLAEQAIADRQAQLKTLATSPLPPVRPVPPPSAQQVTQAEKNDVLYNELGPLVQKNQWHPDEHREVADRINKAQTRHQLDVAKKYMHDCDVCRVAYWEKCNKANADKKAGAISFLESVKITDAAVRDLQAGRYAALQEMLANW